MGSGCLGKELQSALKNKNKKTEGFTALGKYYEKDRNCYYVHGTTKRVRIKKTEYEIAKNFRI